MNTPEKKSSQLFFIPNFQYVADNIKSLRIKNNLNQTQMADIIGVNQSQYSKIERGRQPLNICQLLQLCAWFRVEPNYFFKKADPFVVPDNQKG